MSKGKQVKIPAPICRGKLIFSSDEDEKATLFWQQTLYEPWDGGHTLWKSSLFFANKVGSLETVQLEKGYLLWQAGAVFVLVRRTGHPLKTRGNAGCFTSDLSQERRKALGRKEMKGVV